jgi:nucleoside-diphosphate-sugar epimerase
MESKPRVLVTGISGYIGSWVTLRALESGKYLVRGTVRNAKDEDKLKILKEAFKDRYEEIELVQATLTDQDSIDKAVEGCEYVLHVASPFPLESPKDENEVIGPAVDGTEGIMKACHKHKVKRVVVTSSCAAIADYTLGDVEINEEHWPEITKDQSPYFKSKIYAEKAAWDYIEKLPEEEKFELSTINPGFVVGPLLAKMGGTSVEVVSQCLTGKMPGIPACYTQIIDVRDVADAHIRALESEPYKRYALSTETVKFLAVGQILNDEFSKLGYRVRARCSIFLNY